MATSKILATYETGSTLTISLAVGGAGLANGAGRLSEVVDNTTTRASMAQIWVRTKAGPAAPTANTPIKVYLVRHSNMATSLADNALGVADAALATEPTQAECIGHIIVASTASAAYEKSFLAYDLAPKNSVAVWNAVGQTLSAVTTDHIVQYIPLTPEAQ